MKQVVTSERRPIKIWADDLEDKALYQAHNMANLPFIFKHVAIMADGHMGYGMPIGGVMATRGVVVPNAVGVDIGCGMCAVRTNIEDLDKAQRIKICDKIREAIPVGPGKHNTFRAPDRLMPEDRKVGPIIVREYESARHQIGTLGGGNHFIELQMGSDGFVWVMIHSGSRNLGYKVAKDYNEQAISLNQQWYSKVSPVWELAFLPMDHDTGQAYISDMKYCVEFALANRSLMMGRVKNILGDVLGDVSFGEMINKAHNYAELENHFGKNVMVHRKGATRARRNEIGIIPGSQGTKSFIVKGKGETQSFMSCSHGAGRAMGRKAAIRDLSLSDEIKKMELLGVVHGMKTDEDLDEAPGSYKDIDQVMANQSDLVDIVVELTPLAVVKG